MPGAMASSSPQTPAAAGPPSIRGSTQRRRSSPWSSIPRAPQLSLPGTSAGVFKTSDGGSKWSAVNAGLTNLKVSALVINPANPSTIYAGTSGGVFRSTDSGGAWSAVNGGLSDLEVSSLVINPASPSTIYAGTFAAVFRSADSGGAWSALGAGLPDLRWRSLNFAVALDAAGGTTLFLAGSDKGVWQMTLPPSTTFLLPTSAHSGGPHGAFYTTNVSLSNTGGGPLAFTMKFLGHDQDGSSGPEQTFNLEAGRSVTYFDVLGSVFGQTSNYGAIRIASRTKQPERRLGDLDPRVWRHPEPDRSGGPHVGADSRRLGTLDPLRPRGRRLPLEPRLREQRRSSHDGRRSSRLSRRGDPRRNELLRSPKRRR